MAAIATGTNNLSPFEQETLHLRLATAASLGDDPNDFTEGIISDILSGRNEPVPQYNPDWTTNDHAIRTQILNDDKRVWDAVFAAIENGQIDVLDHFIALGFDISRRSPQANQYPVFVAVKASQSNIMRHLINLKADVNGWSSMTPGIVDFGRDNAIVRTPLMIAAEQGNLNICKILCETAFADPMLIAPDGQTAQRLAARNGHKEVVQYLPAHRGGSWRRLKCNPPFLWSG
jgi:ankyrin repeat protein